MSRWHLPGSEALRRRLTPLQTVLHCYVEVLGTTDVDVQVDLEIARNAVDARRLEGPC